MGLYKNTNGSLDLLAGSTQYADAPLGAILPYGGTTAPNGWFICDGTAINRTDYAELFAVIGTSFGAGDGSTTFNIPDMRESVPKGAGLTGHTVGAHLDANGLAVGEFLDDRVQTHTHTYLNNYVHTAYRPADSGNQSGYNDTQTRTTNSNNGRSGDTTEVKSVGVNYIIKAKITALPHDLETVVEDAIDNAIVDVVADGNLNAVTSNAVYDYVDTMITQALNAGY